MCVGIYVLVPYRGVPSNCLQKASFLLLFRYKKYAKKAQKRKDDYTTHGTHAIALDAVLVVHGDWRFVASSTLRERREETRVVRGSACRLLFRRRRTDGEERPRTKSARGDDDAAERPFESLDGRAVRRWERDSRVSSSDLLFSVLFDPRERTRTRFPLFFCFRFRYKKILIQKVQTNRTI